MSPRFDRAVRDRNAHAGKPWSAADRARQLADVKSWLTTFQRGEPCACGCGGWPFPNAPYHLAPEAA